MRKFCDKIRSLKKHAKLIKKNHQSTAPTPMIFAKFRLVFPFFAFFIFAKKCEISRKSYRNTNEKVRIFSRNVLFAANPRRDQLLTFFGLQINASLDKGQCHPKVPNDEQIKVS